MIQQELNEHKYKIKILIDNLINTQNINEEIMLNNEIKNETEFIISLLNIKRNLIMNQMIQGNNMNFNQLNIGCNRIGMNQPNIVSNNLNPFIQNQAKMNIIFYRVWDLKGSNINIICSPQDKISDLIQIYRTRLNDYEKRVFMFNATKIDQVKKISEIGIKDKEKILVIPVEDLKGGDKESILVGILLNYRFEKDIEIVNNQ
jgi:phenolic acid decarboxylase